MLQQEEDRIAIAAFFSASANRTARRWYSSVGLFRLAKTHGDHWVRLFSVAVNEGMTCSQVAHH